MGKDLGGETIWLNWEIAWTPPPLKKLKTFRVRLKIRHAWSDNLKHFYFRPKPIKLPLFCVL